MLCTFIQVESTLYYYLLLHYLSKGESWSNALLLCVYVLIYLPC